MPYQLTDKHTTGDAGLTAEGDTLEQIFADSAYGLMEIMVDTDNVGDKHKLEFSLEDEELEQLYYSWLSELIYYKDAEDFLIKKCELEIEKNDKYKLRAILYGDKIDYGKHTLKIDVKAVTFYRFKIEHVDNIWKSEVVFDL